MRKTLPTLFRTHHRFVTIRCHVPCLCSGVRSRPRPVLMLSMHDCAHSPTPIVPKEDEKCSPTRTCLLKCNHLRHICNKYVGTKFSLAFEESIDICIQLTATKDVLQFALVLEVYTSISPSAWRFTGQRQHCACWI